MKTRKKEPEEIKSKFIICCIPLSWQFIPVAFFESWCKMVSYSAGKYILGMVTANCCYMDKVRDDLVEFAMEHNPDYILWLDADQIYPADTPERLMRHVDDGRLVVGGLTPDRGSGEPLVFEMLPGDEGVAKRSDVMVGQGLIKVDAMGFGGIMTSSKVFKMMKPPYFQMTWNRKLKGSIGEDIKFYTNCKHAGIDVWCDTNLFYAHLNIVPVKLKL